MLSIFFFVSPSMMSKSQTKKQKTWPGRFLKEQYVIPFDGATHAWCANCSESDEDETFVWVLPEPESCWR